MGPGAWFFSCLFIWILALPFFLNNFHSRPHPVHTGQEIPANLIPNIRGNRRGEEQADVEFIMAQFAGGEIKGRLRRGDIDPGAPAHLAVEGDSLFTKGREIFLGNLP